MKKFTFMVLALSALVLAGCGNTTHSTSVTTGSMSWPTQRQIYDASWIEIFTDAQTGSISLTMDPAAVADGFAVALMSGDKIHLEIAPATQDSGAALRVNQIQLPDSQFEGPFSSVLDYTAAQSGSYQFSFGQDLMAAEDHYTGTAIVQIMISR